MRLTSGSTRRATGALVAGVAVLALGAGSATASTTKPAQPMAVNTTVAAAQVKGTTPPLVVTKRFTRNSSTKILKCPLARHLVKMFFVPTPVVGPIDCNSPPESGSGLAGYRVPPGTNKWGFGFAASGATWIVTQLETKKKGRYLFLVRCMVTTYVGPPEDAPNDPCKLKRAVQTTVAAAQTVVAASTKKEVDSKTQESGLTCSDARASAAKAFRRYRYAIRRAGCPSAARSLNAALLTTARWDYIVIKVQRGLPGFRHWVDIVDKEVHWP